MFIKETSRARKDGSTVTYLQLVVSQWDPRKQTSRQRVLHNLGRKDQLDLDALRRAMESFARYLAPADPDAPLPAATTPPPRAAAPPPPPGPAAPLGLPWLLLTIWRDQGWDAALAPLTDDLDALRALALARATDPAASPHRDSPLLPWLTASPPPLLAAPALTAAHHPWPRLAPPALLLHAPRACGWSGAPAAPWLALTLDQDGHTLHHHLWTHEPPPPPPPPALARQLTLQALQALPDGLAAESRRFLWALPPQAHPAFEALLTQRGRYREATGALSFRHSPCTLDGRRLHALLLRDDDAPAASEDLADPLHAALQAHNPWAPRQRLVLLTDDAQTDPERLLLAWHAAAQACASLAALRGAAALRAPADPLRDLWLDLCALALLQHAQRLTQRPWRALAAALAPLQAIAQQGAAGLLRSPLPADLLASPLVNPPALLPLP